MNSSPLTKVRDLIQKETRAPFFKQIDLYGFEEGMLIGVSGAVGMGFLIEPCDLLLQSDEMITDYENRMRKFLNSFPEGVVLHFVVRASEGSENLLHRYAQAIPVQDEVTRKFVESKVRAWRQNPFFSKSTYLFVCLYPQGKRPRSS